MDLKGSLLDTKIRIVPSKALIDFIKTIPITKEVPTNIVNYIKDDNKPGIVINEINIDSKSLQLTNKDFEIIQNIEKLNKTPEKQHEESQKDTEDGDDKATEEAEDSKEIETANEDASIAEEETEDPFLTTSDLDWLYLYAKSKRGKENIPYLHKLLEGAEIQMPPNKVLKRNPDLEARCVKLRAQQEAREYRKMTKSVDNVRIRYPEDSIAYQMKQLNRHLIAIGQFLLSIFAGFLFGFRGVEWMVGNLDFGFRLLLGVMCALVIALAEIYFLAKKLNEELSVPETVQLGGPAKFANDSNYALNHAINNKKAIEKEHLD